MSTSPALGAWADKHPDEIEWATLLPNGKICAWPTREHAERAAAASKSFPDGEHPLMARRVGEWGRADDCDCECHDSESGEHCDTCCDTVRTGICDECRSYA